MKTNVCICCGKEYPIENLLHCTSCGCCFCEKCAEKLHGAEFAKDLAYFD